MIARNAVNDSVNIETIKNLSVLSINKYLGYLYEFFIGKKVKVHKTRWKYAQTSLKPVKKNLI